MYYIFNSEGNCIASCDFEPNIEDCGNRGELVIESDIVYSINNIKQEAETIVEKAQEIPVENIRAKARILRDSLRTKIDKYLLPSSTYNDQLVTQEQKDILVQDSLTLARWPATEGWPFIDLPAMSDLFVEFIGYPTWEYPIQETVQTTVEE